MGVKIVVREGEPFDRALGRFKKQTAIFNVGNKWPYGRTFYAPPSMVRNRKRWIKRIRRKAAMRAQKRGG